MTISPDCALRRTLFGAALAALATTPFVANTAFADSHAPSTMTGHHPKAQALRNKGVDFEFKGDTSRVVRFYDGFSYYNGQGLPYGVRRGRPIDDFRRRNAFPGSAPAAPSTLPPVD